MSEEEIIKYIQEEIESETDTFHWFDDTPNNKTRKDIEKSIQAHQGLLDLFNKERELRKELIYSENKELEEFKDRIRELLTKGGGSHFIAKADVEELLEETDE